MSKKPKRKITVDGEPNKIILTKNKKDEQTSMRVPLVKDNKLRKGSHFIHEKPEEHHYDGYINRKKIKSKKDRVLANKGPAIVILDLKQKETFLTDRDDYAEEILMRFMINNPIAAREILKRRKS